MRSIMIYWLIIIGNINNDVESLHFNTIISEGLYQQRYGYKVNDLIVQ
ncbi:MAG: hypothetical protein NVSMB45_08950 [Ginsengibacter sp.]